MSGNRITSAAARGSGDAAWLASKGRGKYALWSLHCRFPLLRGELDRKGPAALSVCLLGLVCLVAVAACGSDSHRADGAGSTGGGPPTDGGPTVTIAFTTPSPLIYVPGDVRALGVEITPPGSYSVRFALVGDPRDAFLDVAEAHTGADGKASVNLTAPTSLATFGIRASAESAFAVLDASPGTKFGQVRVNPTYGGQRTVTAWTATVRTGFACGTGVPPSDGPLRTVAPAGFDLLIQSVPADTPLTVTLRAGHFAGGCVEIPRIDASLTTDVDITATDRPLQLDGLDMPVALRLEITQPVIDAWTALAASLSASLTGGAATDATAVLDAMSASLDATTAALFTAERTSKGWDAALLATPLGTSSLRDAVTRYVSRGLPAPESTFIAGKLTTVTGDTGTLSVGAIAGLGPTLVGFSDVIYLSLTAETEDRVLFGGTATWQPSRLAAALALGPATAEVAGVTSVAGALAKWADCPAVATTLVDTGTGFAYGTCDAACVRTACELAIAGMFDRAASSSPSLPLDIAHSGRATTIDDAAHPLRIEGSWVGTTTLTGSSVTLGGTALTGASP